MLNFPLRTDGWTWRGCPFQVERLKYRDLNIQLEGEVTV